MNQVYSTRIRGLHFSAEHQNTDTYWAELHCTQLILGDQTASSFNFSIYSQVLKEIIWGGFVVINSVDSFMGLWRTESVKIQNITKQINDNK